MSGWAMSACHLAGLQRTEGPQVHRVQRKVKVCNRAWGEIFFFFSPNGRAGKTEHRLVDGTGNTAGHADFDVSCWRPVHHCCCYRCDGQFSQKITRYKYVARWPLSTPHTHVPLQRAEMCFMCRRFSSPQHTTSYKQAMNRVGA